MPRALAPRGTNRNGEFIPMTAHVDIKCMLRRCLHLCATDPPLTYVARNGVDDRFLNDHKIQPLILDFSNARLTVVDASFLVFLRTHDPKELLELVGIRKWGGPELFAGIETS